MKDELIKALEEYIDFIGKELDELAVLAHVHGWQSSRVKEGEKKREYITYLKAKINQNN